MAVAGCAEEEVAVAGKAAELAAAGMDAGLELAAAGIGDTATFTGSRNHT